MKKTYSQLLIGLLLLIYSTSSFASLALSTSSLQEVQKKVNELNKKYESSNVLVVFDIDNTLLAMEEDLGSDQWFSWQENFIFNQKEYAKKAGKVSSNFNELLEAQGVLFYLGSMRTPEKTTSSLVQSFQEQGNTVFALTSRGYEFQYQTLRELLRNGIDLSKSKLRFVPTFLRPKLAFDPKTVYTQYGFKKNQAKSFKLDKSRKVQFLDGVFYTSGLHKGVMLKIILKEAKLSPKAVVFVDDKLKHTQRVQEVFENSPIEVVTYHYQKEDSSVNQFNQSDKSKVINQWEKVKSLYY